MDNDRVIVVANQKGGVGKTTTVIQIASGLAKRGTGRVLMMDGDPQGNLSLFFGASGRRDFGQLLTVLRTERRVALPDFICRNVRRNLDLLPAGNRDLRHEQRDADIVASYEAFSAFVSSLRERYAYIIIDSSPSHSPLERLLIRSCDAVIVPLEFQLFSVSGLESIIDEVRACSEETGREIRVHSLVFTKAENKLNRVRSYREIFSTFHLPVFEVCKSEYITRSLEKSRTIWECGPASFAARDYREILTKGFPVTT